MHDTNVSVIMCCCDIDVMSFEDFTLEKVGCLAFQWSRVIFGVVRDGKFDCALFFSESKVFRKVRTVVAVKYLWAALSKTASCTSRLKMFLACDLYTSQRLPNKQTNDNFFKSI